MVPPTLSDPRGSVAARASLVPVLAIPERCAHMDPTPSAPVTVTRHTLTRLEVIDETGLVLRRQGVTVALASEEDGQVLKVFINWPPPPTKPDDLGHVRSRHETDHD